MQSPPATSVISPRRSSTTPTGACPALARVSFKPEDIVTADDTIVWQGTLPAIILQFQGPPSLRSDNARVLFDFAVTNP